MYDGLCEIKYGFGPVCVVCISLCCLLRENEQHGTGKNQMVELERK